MNGSVDLVKLLNDEDMAFIDDILTENTSLVFDIPASTPSTLSPAPSTTASTTSQYSEIISESPRAPDFNDSKSSSIDEKKRTTGTRVRKRRQTEELGNLRQEVKVLENQLKQLQIMAEARTETAAYDVTRYGIWKQMALRQESAVNNANKEKKELQQTYNQQLAWIETLQQLLHIRMQCELPSIWTQSSSLNRYEVIRIIKPFEKGRQPMIFRLQQAVEMTSTIIHEHKLAELTTPQQIVYKRSLPDSPLLHFVSSTCIFAPVPLDLVVKAIWKTYSMPLMTTKDSLGKCENPRQIAAEGTLRLKRAIPVVHGNIVAHNHRLDSKRALAVLQFMGSMLKPNNVVMHMQETEWILVEEVIDDTITTTNINSIGNPVKTIIRIATRIDFQSSNGDESYIVSEEQATHFMEKYKESQEESRQQFENTIMEMLKQEGGLNM